MVNSLIQKESLGLDVPDDNDIESLTKTSVYLPQIRVYGSSTDAVKEGKMPMGHLGLYISSDSIVDLGEQFDSLALAWRPRSSSVGGDSPINFYGQLVDSKWEYSKGFTDFKTRAMSKEKGYLAGLEFLMYIPTLKKFALLFMGNPTLRREGANVKALIGCGVTLKVKLIKTTTYTWHGCDVFECTTPFDLPSDNDIKDQMVEFRKPKDSNVEFVDEPQGSTGRAR